jgi:(R)-benzylsuccinyl-CoA dehydrogenase
MIGEFHPYQVFFDEVELEDGQVLGDVGNIFVPLTNRLGIRRLDIASRCVGLASRCLEMMIEQANTRQTFGSPLADKQAIQWWISDSYQEIEMVRLLIHRLAWKIDQGVADFRRDGSMVKVQATELIQRVSDRAIQLFGGMGLSKELPLEYIARMCRVLRIVEGPSEVHRWVIARDLLRNGLPQQ